MNLKNFCIGIPIASLAIVPSINITATSANATIESQALYAQKSRALQLSASKEEITNIYESASRLMESLEFRVASWLPLVGFFSTPVLFASMMRTYNSIENYFNEHIRPLNNHNLNEEFDIHKQLMITAFSAAIPLFSSTLMVGGGPAFEILRAAFHNELTPMYEIVMKY